MIDLQNIDFQTVAKYLGAYGAGVVTAGFFLSGPVMEGPAQPARAVSYQRQAAYQQPVAEPRRAAPAEQAVAASTSAPPIASTEPPADAAPQAASGERRGPVRVIPIERAGRSNVETTGSGVAATRTAERDDASERSEPGRAGPSCNVSVCRERYRSFDEATCTYQPYDGPRQLCTR